MFNDNYKLIAANDDYFPEPYPADIQMRNDLIPNKQYWIQVDGSGGGTMGIFSMNIFQAPLGIDQKTVPGQPGLFHIYPNPFETAVTLEYKGETPDNFNLKIRPQ